VKSTFKIFAAAAVVFTAACEKPVPTPEPEKPMTTSIYDIPVQTIDEKDATLAPHKGKVLLAVNVASECGYTPQYAGLQALYAEFKDKGFEILGFPSNDFGAQEPGSNSEIKLFCQSKFDVAFPMYAKIPVKGPEKHPLYAHLTGNAPETGEVSWNFEKFLVGKDGAVVGRFKSDVAPDSAQLREAIEAALN
jgi:glutathione peroxidase